MPEKRRFYSIAFGSFRETQANLELADAMTVERLELLNKLGVHLSKLIQSCERGAG